MPDQAVQVSIIMPVYNAAATVAQSIRSVLDQSFRDWELIVVDDCSSDRSLEQIQATVGSDPRIRIEHLDTNQGVARARNHGLRLATGKYLCFLDSDDLWEADKLMRQVALMEQSGCLVSYGAYRRIDEAGHNLGLVSPPPRVDYERLLKSNFIGNLTGMYNARELGKQYFSEFRHEDYVAWLSLVKKAGSASRVDGLLGSYRVYSGSTSANKLKAATWQWRIYRESEKLGLLRSFWYMNFYLAHAIGKRV